MEFVKLLVNAFEKDHLSYFDIDFKQVHDLDEKSKRDMYEFYNNKKEKSESDYYVLACCLWNGIGSQIDQVQAFDLFEKAAVKKKVIACFDLGVFYYQSLCWDQSLKYFLIVMETKIEKFCREASNGIGCVYEFGEKDYKNAFIWFQKSSDMNYYAAHYNLANCYEMGLGVEKDMEKAIILYNKSAFQGDERGQQKMFQIYLEEKNVRGCIQILNIMTNSKEKEKLLKSLIMEFPSSITRSFLQNEGFKLSQIGRKFHSLFENLDLVFLMNEY